jgi:hypothetical protein
MSEPDRPLLTAAPLVPAQALRHKLQHWIGLDRAILFTVLARFWGAFSGLVTLFLITRFLSPNQQGYYYTFYSIVALQIVFELGFSFVVLQLAAHERAYLTFLPDGVIEGDAVAHSRLASVLHKAVYWYMGAGVLMAVALIPAGLWFFSSHPTHGAAVAWKLPWILLVLAAMLAFQIDPVFSFLEGCGFVAQVAQRRFTQALLGSALAWSAMVLHKGLFAPALLIFGQVFVGFAFLVSNRHRMLLGKLLRYPVAEHFVGWRKEIWPFQWKIAVSWLCGYFIYQLFSPVLFAFQGAEAAGRMGMSLNVAAGIGSVAIAWMNTKASPFGALVARGEFQQLDRLFFRTLRQSTALLIFGAGLFLLLLAVYGHFVPRFSSRLLPLWAVGILLVGAVMNHIVYSEALYLRAHKQEPFLLQAIISAILIGSLTVFLGKYYGANAIVIGLLIQGVLFGFPYATYIFVSKRRKWHRQTRQVNTENS